MTVVSSTSTAAVVIALAVASVTTVVEILAAAVALILICIGTTSSGRLALLAGDTGGAVPLGLAVFGGAISLGMAGGTIPLGVAGDIHIFLWLRLVALRAGAVSSGRHLWYYII